ncbi:hypothetical protein RUM43_000899 [Polyplax serrata]|uniref:Double-strand break repair protein n=1 Tax=Polyplax serrata TaxID=468196 RepID=A0AAN8SFD1_POLSC
MSNVFSFLIATDCHLGYEESNHIIGDDSFITFEEILLKAVQHDVDLILLGGDLFHYNNPSQKCMNKCMELLRMYTLGNKPVYFELLSNAREVFSNPISETTNYLDDNINVSIPVFSIHGNHDDPSGVGHFSALDTLSSAGLVNYFGKWTDLLDIKIKPILLRKGKTKVALYGLSHIKDDRLCRLFMDKKVTFIRPEVEPEGWFNIFVLHQNRVDRGPKRFISESYIPDFMDLVIWGHEHDCEIEPRKNEEKGFYVIQPGSSVPTSLSEGESLPKHVAVLKVFEKKMKIIPLKLNTVRPFVWRTEKLWTVNTSTEEQGSKSEEIKVHCAQIVEEMIREAEQLKSGHPKQPKLPLIRLRCEYSDETQLFNIVKFGQLFQGRVATPNSEIVRLKRSVLRATKKEPKYEDLMRLNELYKDNLEEDYNFTSCVNHIVKDYFTNHEEAKMLILRLPDMASAVEQFIDKDDILAIDDLVEKSFDKMLKDLKQQKVNGDETNLTQLFERMREEDEKSEQKEEKEFQEKYKKIVTKTTDSEVEHSKEGSREEDLFSGQDNNVRTRQAIASDSDTDGSDAGTSRMSNFNRSKSPSVDSDNDFFNREMRKKSDADREDDKKSRGRGRGRGRGGRGRAKTTDKNVKPKSSQVQMKITSFYDDDSD